MSAVRKLAELIHEHATPPVTVEEARSIALGMRRAALASHRLAEAGCDRELTRREKREDERLDDRFTRLCERIGAKANIGGDPRGYVYKVLFPVQDPRRRPANTWGGPEEGWGV